MVNKKRTISDWCLKSVKSERVKIKGKVYRKYDPKTSNVPPLRDYWTVSINLPRPLRDGQKTVLLKFPTKKEMDQQCVVEKEIAAFEGDLCPMDGRWILLKAKRIREEDL